MDDSSIKRIAADHETAEEWRIRQVTRIEATLEGCSEHRTGRDLVDWVASTQAAATVA